jgi:NhaP-type Na+/H+ or K+/H+ antiporter
VARAVFPELSWPQALLLAAILAPTDAALGQAVVSSPLLPVRIRQSLNVESGLNDGIALPIVLVLAALAGAPADHVAAQSAFDWAQFALLQVTLGPLVGAAVGFLGGRLVAAATARGWVNDAFEELASVGLALLAFATAELVHGNGFIAAFVAGLVVGNTARGICKSINEFGEAEGQLLTLLVFLVFGAVLVPEAWPHVDGRTWLYAILSLTLVRMLPVALSLLGAGLRPASFVFLGWFGPRGLASILFALLVVGHKMAEGPQLAAVVTLTVLLSTFLHGITAYPLARLYGAHIGGKRLEAHAEHQTVSEHPVRHRHRPKAAS